MLVKEAEPKIVEHLKSRKLAFDFFETSRKAQCRCGGEIVVAVLPDQWFLDFNANDWKEKSFKCLEKMIIFPEEYRKQFNDTFNWLDKRPCARRRGLGTKLPYNKEWIIESLSDSTIYMAFYTVIKKIREFSLKPENLVEEFFDYVFLGRGTAVEISGKCGTTASNLDSIRSEFLYWYPNDQRHTSIAHVTNHLSFFIFAHAGIFEERHWPKAITLNNMLIAEGSKMSKSKGNIIPLNDIQEKYSADLFRLYVASAADFGGVLDFRDREVEHARKSLQKFAFVIEEAIASQDSGDSRMSKWLESRFQNSVKKAEEALEAFGVREYVQTAFYGVLRDVDYFNRRTGGKESSTVRKIAREWVLLLSPVIPHLCEELWEKMKEKGFASHAAWPTVVEGKINPVAEGEELFVQSVLQDARSIQKITKGVSKNARIIIAKGGKWQEASDTLSKAKSPEEIPEVSQSVKSLLQKRFYELKENGLKKMDEQSIIEDAKEFLRRETGITFSTEREEESKSARREKAAPTKPAIELY
jgi:leucyl-tRNA synthetase